MTAVNTRAIKTKAIGGTTPMAYTKTPLPQYAAAFGPAQASQVAGLPVPITVLDTTKLPMKLLVGATTFKFIVPTPGCLLIDVGRAKERLFNEVFVEKTLLLGFGVDEGQVLPVPITRDGPYRGAVNQDAYEEQTHCCARVYAIELPDGRIDYRGLLYASVREWVADVNISLESDVLSAVRRGESVALRDGSKYFTDKITCLKAPANEVSV